MATLTPLTDEQQKLVEENRGLVHTIVGRYRSHEAFDDFVSAGYERLTRAVGVGRGQCGV